MANNVKSQFSTLTTKDTLPLSTSTAVTITAASGASSFTLSAAITTDFREGSYIWDTANDVLYKVRELAKDGLGGTIFGTFEDTLSGGAMAYIKSKDLKNIKIFAKALAATTIDGAAFASGDVPNLDSLDERGSFGGNWVIPHIYDGATGNFTYYIKKF